MKAASLILSCLLFLNAPYAYSHGGGLNSDGCHNTSSGGYHCHGVASSSGGDSSGGDGGSVPAWLVIGGAISVALYIASLVIDGNTEKTDTPDKKGILDNLIEGAEEDEDEEDDEESLRYKKEDSFSVSTTPLLIPQGGGLSLELSF